MGYTFANFTQMVLARWAQMRAPAIQDLLPLLNSIVNFSFEDPTTAAPIAVRLKNAIKQYAYFVHIRTPTDHIAYPVDRIETISCLTSRSLPNGQQLWPRPKLFATSPSTHANGTKPIA
jgi:pentose-5-phosphate-3-epimerase